jgi:hypothetical protein
VARASTLSRPRLLVDPARGVGRGARTTRSCARGCVRARAQGPGARATPTRCPLSRSWTQLRRARGPPLRSWCEGSTRRAGVEAPRVRHARCRARGARGIPRQLSIAHARRPLLPSSVPTRWAARRDEARARPGRALRPSASRSPSRAPGRTFLC